MYVQQRDEYLESFCKMATRKISVITIFGTMNNSSMKIDHFQLGSIFFLLFSFHLAGTIADSKGRNFPSLGQDLSKTICCGIATLSNPFFLFHADYPHFVFT